MTALSDPNTWVEKYGDALYRYALIRLQNPALAEDLVQETFLAALDARHRFAGQSAEKTWLIGILKHKMIDHLRKQKKVRESEDIEVETDRQQAEMFDENGMWATALSEWDNPKESLEKTQFWETFRACVANLPAHLADLFILREINGLPSEEVCKVLDITTTNNMWVMLSRTRMRLRQCLEERWFDGSARSESE